MPGSGATFKRKEENVKFEQLVKLSLGVSLMQSIISVSAEEKD